jgi:prepilin-type N-terminal cleavage/methylation domain-containing protein
MNAHRVRSAHRRLRAERGFTLIELMVATLAGIIVSAATGAIVITSVHFSSNLTDRVDANQQARVAMEKIVQALNSSCVAPGITPILAGSDANDAIFYSLLASDIAVGEPSTVEVSLSGSPQSLVMSTWVNTSPAGSAPAQWTFASTPTNYVLLQYAAPPASTINGSTSVFQYYAYSGGSISTTAIPAAQLPLSVATAATVAKVTISFKAIPSNNSSATGRVANITDSVVMRLSPASAGGANIPCT